MDTHINDDLNIILDSIWIKEDSNLKIATGIEGALNFQQHVVESYGGTYTKEDRRCVDVVS